MKENSDILLKNNEGFSSLINLIYKATENYQKIFTQNISQINQILSLIENDLQSISTNKIKNIKSILNSNQKSFLTYINDTKISLNNIQKKSKEISLQIMTINKSKPSIDIDILSSEIKRKEDEMTNLNKNINFLKEKINKLNQNLSEAEKTISDLKKENLNYKVKMLDNEKNFYIQNQKLKNQNENLDVINKEKNEILELNNKIKELKDEIEINKKNYENNLSRMTEKNLNLSNNFNKKNQELTKLQSDNIDKIKENSILKKQLEKKNIKEKEYIEKIDEYQKQIEINDKELNDKKAEIIYLTDDINNNKLLIKSLETEIEKIKFEKNKNINEQNDSNKILDDLEKIKKEKEIIENELENTKKLLENNKLEFKQKIDLMVSTVNNNNIIINEKDKLIEQLRLNDNLQEQTNEQNLKIEELNDIINQKEQKIKELNSIIEKNKSAENKENQLAKKQLLEYKNDFEINMNLINVLKEQIRSLEKENKTLKENIKNNNNDNQLFDMTKKMLKLQEELDKLRNKPPQTHFRSATGINQLPPEFEKKYSELESEYKGEKQKYENKINELRNQITQLKSQIAYDNNINKMNIPIDENDKKIINNNNNNNSNEKPKIALISSSNVNLEVQYNQILEKFNKANDEIKKLKKKIEKLELEKKMQKESLFKFKSVKGDEDYEEEIDLIQLKEGVRRRNRSEDRRIDFPGYDENQKKYEELEDKYNNLKEQLIPILKENSGNNKSNMSKICSLLGTSVNTTNNILQNYK